MQDDSEVLPFDGLYVPAGQATHDINDALPVDGLYVPAGQATHDDDDVLPTDGLYVPMGQWMHDKSEVLPFDGLYVPAGQEMQADLLKNGLYVPAWQAVHVAALLPAELLKVPGAQSTQPNPFKLITEPAKQKGQSEVMASAGKRSLYMSTNEDDPPPDVQASLKYQLLLMHHEASQVHRRFTDNIPH